ncbi:MAG: hypothetical protein JSV88_33740 [Candidatus Aminicenantes bacterium]|nr:MAG: hypothetical protein JSV88_33740 [Candidatus Aminicenantes bacterium]
MNKENKESIKSLHTERSRRLQVAIKKLLDDDDIKGAEKQLEWLETSAKLVPIVQQTNKRKWIVVIGMICLVIVGLAWTVRIFSTHVSLKVTTGNVVLSLRENWSSNHQFAADEIFIDNIIVDSGKVSNSLELKGLDGEKIIVNQLQIRKGAEIELSVKGHELTIFVKGARLSGSVNAHKARMEIETDEGADKPVIINTEIPETIAFRTARVGPVPVQLRITSNEKWKLRGMQTQAIGFVEEFPPGSGNMESVIGSGELTLLETDRKVILSALDHLTLGKAKSRRLELSKADNGLRVQAIFEGSVSKVLVGTEDFRDNLTPTYLQYLYHQQGLKLFWGALVFLMGIMWRIRSTIFS